MKEKSKVIKEITSGKLSIESKKTTQNKWLYTTDNFGKFEKGVIWD